MSDDLNNGQRPSARQNRANAYAGAARTQHQQGIPSGANGVVTTVPSSASPQPKPQSNRTARQSAATAGKTAAGRPNGVGTTGPSASGSAAGAKGGIARIAIIAAIVVVALVAIIAAGFWWFGSEGAEFYDTAATEGQAPYKTDEEIQAELSRVVEEGMLNISIASVIEFENGTSPGVAYIENVPSNKYVMRVEITLDDNGESVYQSGGIRPNNYIESITLTKDLDAGSYPATATFTAFDPDTLEEVGQAAAKVTLAVEN